MSAEVLRYRWIWPGVILGSGMASGLFFFLSLDSPLRLITTLWFLLVCPGMAFVRLLRLGETYYEWTLAIALSISLDALVACILLYTGLWSIELGLTVVIVMSLLGAGLQLWPDQPRAIKSQSKIPDLHENAMYVLKCPSCEAETKQRTAGFTRSRRQKYRCGHCQRVYSLDPHSQESQIEAPQPFRSQVMEKRRYNTIQWILHVNPRNLTKQLARALLVSGTKPRLKRRSQGKRIRLRIADPSAQFERQADVSGEAVTSSPPEFSAREAV